MSNTSDTVTQENTVALGNTKTNARSRGWIITLNNYTEEELDFLKVVCTQKCTKYILGDEVGKSGTPHIQGWMYFKNGVSMASLKKLSPRAHWERAKGNAEQNKVYCSKDKVICMAGIVTFKEELHNRLRGQYDGTIWKPWQQEIIDLTKTRADTRTINWICDYEGNSGKSFLTKYLALTERLIIADGKKDNIFNQINNKLNPKDGQGEEFDLVILDIPRSGEGYINYGVLEQIKNGLLYSGKYEGGLCIFDNVHIVVFANFMPDKSQFSEDRWNIIELKKQ